MTHTARHFVWQIDGARALAFVRQIETSTLLRSHVFCFIEFISWHNFFFFEYKVEGDLHAVVEQMLEQVDLATVADHCVDTFRLLAAIETKSSCFCFVWFSRNVLFVSSRIVCWSSVLIGLQWRHETTSFTRHRSTRRVESNRCFISYK